MGSNTLETMTESLRQELETNPKLLYSIGSESKRVKVMYQLEFKGEIVGYVVRNISNKELKVNAEVFNGSSTEIRTFTLKKGDAVTLNRKSMLALVALPEFSFVVSNGKFRVVSDGVAIKDFEDLLNTIVFEPYENSESVITLDIEQPTKFESKEVRESVEAVFGNLLNLGRKYTDGEYMASLLRKLVVSKEF